MMKTDTNVYDRDPDNLDKLMDAIFGMEDDGWAVRLIYGVNDQDVIVVFEKDIEEETPVLADPILRRFAT